MLDRECPLEQSSERPANRLRSRRGLPPLANLRDAQYQKLRQLTEKTFSVIKNTGKDGGLPLPLGDERGSYIAQFPSTSLPGVWKNEYANLALAETIGIEGPAVAQRRADPYRGFCAGVRRMPLPQIMREPHIMILRQR